MTRNLVICVVPTVIALLAVYWYRKKKRIKLSDSVNSTHAIKQHINQQDSSSECTSDLANTLSDASSFTSPVSSEKSLRTISPSVSSPLHHIDEENVHNLQNAPNCISKKFETDISFSTKDKDFYKLEGDEISESSDSSSEQLQSSNSEWNSLEYENVKTDDISQITPANDIDYLKTDKIYLSSSKNIPDSQSHLKIENCHTEYLNNHNNIQSQNIVENEKVCDFNEESIFSNSKECEKMIEIDSHSSVFDENSLSFISDDSEYKQLVECKNKDSLSSVLDENSLLGSFCDELEKSTASNSPSSKPDNFDIDNCGSPQIISNSIPCKDFTLLLDSETSTIKNVIHTSNLVNDNNLNGDVMINENTLVTSTLNTKPSIDISNNTCSNITDTLSDNLADNDCKQEVDTVQNILSKVSLETVPFERNLNCDNVKPESNIRCSFESKSGSVSETYSLLPGSVDLKLNCDLKSTLSSDENSKCNISSSSKIKNDSVELSSTNSSQLNPTKNHLGAAADVVQRISSDLSTSFSALFTNSSSLNSPVQKSRMHWSPSLSKKETPFKSDIVVSTNATTDSNQICDKKDSALVMDELIFSEEIKDSNCVLNTESSKTIVSNLENQNSTSSSSTEINENHCKDRKPLKNESNGITDSKASSQSSSEFVYEFELPQELCGRLIGKHGRHVKSIMERSNANVFIKRHPFDPLLKVVVVEGQRSDVNDALEIIRRKYPPSQFPTVTLVQTNCSGVQIPESLQLHLPEGASCDVILSSLVSAGHFFLQQPTHPTYPSLSTLDQCMISLYSQMDTPLLPQPIEAGVICAAPVYRGWYRAQVIYVCDNGNDCGIKFVDYGGFSQVPISTLRQIRSDFMSLPFQASECYLAHVRPVGNESWSAEATSIFEELAQGQILQALLIEYADDGIPCVYLYRVQGVSSMFINKELVERGLAVWINNTHWDPH